MKLKALKPLAMLLILTAVMVLPYFVFAQAPASPGAQTINIESDSNPMKMLNGVATGVNGPYNAADENTLPEIIGLIINAALGLLGIIFVILIIYAGYNWMTSSGNEESIKKSKKTMTSAIIGLIIVLCSWSIWVFIFDRLIANM